jgi:3-methyladenine DNA glycosylase/8-oxoguanine DNA glycosylase
MVRRTYRVTGQLDLRRSLSPLSHGVGDATIRFGPGRVWWATRTPDGPVALALSQDGGSLGTLTVESAGPGAERALEAVPALLGGFESPPVPLPDGAHPLIARLGRLHPGVRIPRTAAVLESLVPAILEQKVTGREAHRAWAGLIRTYGEPAPGPAEWRLRLPPAPETLASLPYFKLHPFGIEQRRADLIRGVASRAGWFEAIADLPFEAAYARLRSVPGIGPWTAAEVGVRALGDIDAVSVGDFHLPHLVSFALAGEPRGTDERMLELLEPYRGQRARVVRLLEMSGIQAPKYGPRMPDRRIEGF